MARGAALVFDLVARDGASGTFMRVAGAADKAAVATGRAEKSLGFFGSGAAKSAAKLGAVFGAFELAKKAIDLGKETADFQQKMLMIKTSAGASSAEVKKMSSAVLAMSGPLATSPEKLADALYHVEQNGLRGKQALAALKIGAEGAKIGMADVEDTTNTMTIAMASGIKGVGDLQKAMGFMIATVGTGDMRLKDLNEALSGGILSVAKNYGASLRDVAAVLATLGDNGIRGADAATALRQTLMGFAQPAKGGAKALESVGLGFHDLRDELQKHGLVSAMNDLESHMKSAGITGNKVGAFITEAFGKKAGAGLSVLMGEIDRLNTKYAEAQKGANTFASRWSATTKTAKFQFAELGAEAKATGIAMLMTLLPGATAVGKALVGVGKMGASALGGLMPIVKLVGSGLTLAGDAVGGILKFLNPLAPAIQAVITPVAALWLAFKGAALVTALLSKVGPAMTRVGMMATLQSTKVVVANDATIASNDAVILSNKATIGSWEARAIAAGTASATTTAAALKGDEAQIVANRALIESNLAVAGSSKGRAAGGFLAGGVGKTALGIAGLGIAIDAVSNSVDKQNQVHIGGPLGLLVGTVHGKQFGDLGKVGKIIDANQAKQHVAAVKGADDLALLGEKYKTLAEDQGAASAVAQQYAGMLGITFDKAGKASVDAKTLASAVDLISNAENHATQSGAEFLSAMDTFSKSSGTTADRAALIGATLKAANGDALGFASSMNAGATASTQLSTDMASAAKGVGKTGESVHSFIKSIVNLKAGTINYKNTAAAPLISDLQGMQTAAMNAASAMFQHEKSTKGAKGAADDAYKTFQSLTTGALVGQAKQLGLTSDEAQNLANHYFGMPKDVKTLIEQEGGNPVLDVLNKIGAMLAVFTGQPWNATIDAQGNALSIAKQVHDAINGIPDTKTIDITVNQSVGRTVHDAVNGPGRASGGGAPEGYFAVGERGPEIAHKRGNRVDIMSNSQSKAFIAATGAKFPGFAGGTVGGIRYASNLAYHNALARAASAASKHRNTSSTEAVSSAIGGIGQSYSPPFSVADVGIGRLQATIGAAIRTLSVQMGKGLAAATARGFRAQIAGLTKIANQQLTSLRVKIKGSDLAALRGALKGTADDTRTAFAQILTDVSRAGGSRPVLGRLGAAGNRLVGLQNTIASARDYGTSIGDTLRGAYDPTKAGSIADLHAGLTGATGQNKAYASQLSSLRSRTKGNAALTGLINQLAASGNTATLATLAGASKAELAQTSKDVAAYNSSVGAGVNAATVEKYGKTQAQMQQQQAEILKATAALVSAIATQPTVLEMDGERFSTKVVRSKAFNKAFADLERHLK